MTLARSIVLGFILSLHVSAFAQQDADPSPTADTADALNALGTLYHELNELNETYLADLPVTSNSNNGDFKA